MEYNQMPYPYPHPGMVPQAMPQAVPQAVPQRPSYAQPTPMAAPAPIYAHAGAPAPAPVVQYTAPQLVAGTVPGAFPQVQQITRPLQGNAVGLDLNRDGRADLIVAGTPQDAAPEVLHQDGIGNSAGGYYTTGDEGELKPAGEEEPMRVSLVVPEGATPGTKLQHTAPDGQELRLTVPEGVPAGSIMTLTQDPATKQWKCMAEPAEAPAAPAAPAPAAPVEPPPAATAPAPTATYTAPPQTTDRVMAHQPMPTGAPSVVTTYAAGQAPVVRTIPSPFVGQVMPVNLSYVPPPNATSSVALAPGQVTAGITPAHFNPPRQDPFLPPGGMILEQRPSYTPPPGVVLEQRPSYTPPVVLSMAGQPMGPPGPHDPNMIRTVQAFPPVVQQIIQTPSYVPPPVIMQNNPSYVPPVPMVMGPPPVAMGMTGPEGSQPVQMLPPQAIVFGPCIAAMPTAAQPPPQVLPGGPPPMPGGPGGAPMQMGPPVGAPPVQQLPPGVQLVGGPGMPPMVGQPPVVLQHQVVPQPVPMGPMVGAGTAPGQMMQPGVPLGMPGAPQPMPPHMMVPGGMVPMQHLPPGYQGGPMPMHGVPGQPVPTMQGPPQGVPPQFVPLQGQPAPPAGQEAL